MSRKKTIFTDMLRIPVGKNGKRFAIVSPEDYDFLLQWKWTISNGYIMHDLKTYDKQVITRIAMHRVVSKRAGQRELECVDHINGCRWDNRRENLRPCTRSQNLLNSAYHHNQNGYRGVYKYSNSKRYYGKITYAKQCYELGSYETAIEAAYAYDAAALSLPDSEFRSTNYSMGLVPKQVEANPDLLLVKSYKKP